MLKLVRRWRNAEQARHAVAAMLTSRHPLRLHSFLLFIWTIFAGNMMGRIGRELGLAALPARYALVCVAAYAAFLFGVRVWLWHIEAGPGDDEDNSDMLEASDVGLGGQSTGETSYLADGAGNAATELIDADVAADGDVSVLALAALALAATLAVLLLGPEMLVDVALEAMLAGSLIGAVRLGHEPDWFLRILAKTWWIFLLATGLMVGFGKYAQHHYPAAVTSSEVLQQMFASQK